MQKKLAFFIIMNTALCLLSFDVRCADYRDDESGIVEDDSMLEDEASQDNLDNMADYRDDESGIVEDDSMLEDEASQDNLDNMNEAEPASEDQGGMMDWCWGFMPQTYLSKTAEKMAEGVSVGANKFTKENIAGVNRAVQERIDQTHVATKDLTDHINTTFNATVVHTLAQGAPLDIAINRTVDQVLGQLEETTKRIVDDTNNTLNQTISRTLDQGGPLDDATNRTLGQVSEQLQQTAKGLLDNAKNELQQTSEQIIARQLRPLGHELVIDLTQNIAKSALVTVKGCFGAVLAYANLIAYLDEQSKAMQQDLNSETTQNGSSTNTQGKYMPHTRLCVATVGAATFVSACLLSYYWIR